MSYANSLHAPSRLRFSLATLFLAITLVGIWLGHQVNWARSRQAFLQQKSVTDSTEAYAVRPAVRPRTPGIRMLLGGRIVGQLVVPDEEACAEGERLFPEADVMVGIVMSVPVGR